ncbi:MAG: DUF3782 domain-containing protein [Magnetococcales bacterium]|nr:DUF3782 domain-containing protein [Magnetococcales bacterium]
MPQNLTVDDIWKLFEETNRLFRESEAKSKAEAEARMKEAEARMKETEARLKEAETRLKEAEARQLARQQEADARQKARQQEADAWQKARQQEADARLKEAEARQQEANAWQKEWAARLEHDLQETRRSLRESHAETERVVKEVSKQIGQLGSRWGEFVEGLVAPACETLFAERGIPIHKVSPRVKAKLPGNRRMEIDILVVNTDTVALVEVKSKLKQENVREHLTRLAEFKDFFPEYASRRVLGAVAGIVIEEGVDRFAMSAGLFVIVQSGETVHLANDADFQPRVW